MDRIGRGIFLVIALILVTGLVAGQNQERVGVQQKLSVTVDRGDYGIMQKTTLYCMQQNIERCEDGASIIDVAYVLLGMIETQSSHVQSLSSSDSTTQRVQAIG